MDKQLQKLRKLKKTAQSEIWPDTKLELHKKEPKKLELQKNEPSKLELHKLEPITKKNFITNISYKF